MLGELGLYLVVRLLGLLLLIRLLLLKLRLLLVRWLLLVRLLLLIVLLLLLWLRRLIPSSISTPDIRKPVLSRVRREGVVERGLGLGVHR